MRKLFIGAAALLVASMPLAAFALSPMADAAENNELADLKKLITAKVDVNAVQLDGATALLWAVDWGNTEAVDLLLKAGADVKAVNRLNATPLYAAAASGHAAIVGKLLEAGADPNQTVLSQSETPLMFAARSGNVEAVRLLLDEGADLEAKEKMSGSTALMWAAEQDHPEVLKLLISRGAQVDAETKGRAAEDSGITALILATREGALQSMKVLLDAGASMNHQSANGNTALIVAAMGGNAETIHFLLERGADPKIANKKGWTPLYLTVKARTMETGSMPNPSVDLKALLQEIQLMLESGADVNARVGVKTEIRSRLTPLWLQEPGATAFLRAAFGGDLAVMKLLLAHGADPNIPTTDNTTALMTLSGVGYFEGFIPDFSSQEELLEGMKLLVGLGAKINAANDSGLTALHGAGHKNFVKGIEYLAANGADFTARSHFKSQYDSRSATGSGYIPLDWAEGVNIGPTSNTFHTEAVAMMSKLMVERNLEPVGLSVFSPSRLAKSVSPLKKD
jgi:ankyrin repeat protein